MRTSGMKTVIRARKLRRDMSLPEVRLWQVLRRGRGGFRFRHQHPAGCYALDFYCVSAALCIEVDGRAHDMGFNPERDERRDAWLAGQGIKTLRIPAGEILKDVEPVMILIQQECACAQPLHRLRRSPPPESRGRI